MGTNECSQPASKSSWDSQDFGDVNMVWKMAHFHKSSRPQWVNDQLRNVSWCNIAANIVLKIGLTFIHQLFVLCSLHNIMLFSCTYH